MGLRAPTTIVMVRLAGLAWCCAVIAGCIYLLTVGASVGQLLGELMLGGRPDRAAAESASVLLASVSRTTLLIGSVIVVGWALLQGRSRLAFGIFIVIVGANVTTQLAKIVVLDRGGPARRPVLPAEQQLSEWPRHRSCLSGRRAPAGGPTLPAQGSSCSSSGCWHAAWRRSIHWVSCSVLADRGGSPTLFAVGVVIVIGASFVALGALVYALRDIRLDPV